MFKSSVGRTPERDAIVNVLSEERYTFRDLADSAYSVANSFSEMGVEKGDRIAVCLTNRPEHGIVFLASQIIGAVAVPINFRVPPGKVVYHMEDSKPKVLFFGKASRESVGEAHGDFDCDTCVQVGDSVAEFARPFQDLLEARPDEPEVKVNQEDRSIILYTSGTTGDPKGVPLNHRNAAMRSITYSLSIGRRSRETMLGVMPMYHTVGLHSTFCSMMGMSGTYLSMPIFDPEKAARAVAEENVTILHEAPTILKRIAETKTAKGKDFDTVRKVVYAGSPLNESGYSLIEKTFKPDQVFCDYGMTEVACPMEMVNNRKTDELNVVGRNNFFHRTRIVEIGSDDPEALVEPGEEGELIIHKNSATSFNKYWNKPEKTEEAIKEGWIFTEDTVTETEKGHISITGRTDDMIKSGGENIHPPEVENILTAHPEVKDAAVIGVPDEEWGEKVKAYIHGEKVSKEEMDEWCLQNENLENFKRPKEYEFIEEIPRNPSGKILRYKLREQE
ncbi:hypothetical protein AKJ61_01325 [candidate division MSBL1 archaeon SCGC-AAA259B11]|uniref:Long-chain fatty acid--CoA ligase n=1 Tax=candidate division MSBL1 archaeon SCGC-AAA259B11 TaxID=1698260 RepID=A0A133U7I9_9EURY|nr:hypothetical protein AKJ61_01325 [candidate division MSBL1 archaeon SCGC-AAA259B11]